MFDLTAAFTRQFTPVDGGYVYYPSQKAGGKLVTIGEYEGLLANWNRFAGPTASRIAITILTFSILLWVIIAVTFELPDWATWVTVSACWICYMAWVGWFGFAPRRLVKDRPDIAAPRPASEVRRETRAVLSWPNVICVLFATAAVFLVKLSSFDDTIRSWVWLVGSGALFAAYSSVAILKVNDGRRRIRA